MKIVFICGGLDPGKDGVGDYIRRLVGELIEHGHQAGAVAINDKRITDQVAGMQSIEQKNLPLLLLPSHWPTKDRFARAKEWIDQFDPEWLSLQFVPFALHPKGLPFGLSKLLAKLGTGKRWHIMFHELWVGMDKESILKYKLLGFLQKRIIRSVLQCLKPLVITTNTHLYQYQLTKLGFKTSLLPLFSNIPFRYNYLGKGFNDFKTLTLAIFGNIHWGAPMVEFAKQAAEYTKKNKVIRLIFIGQCGLEKQNWIKVWRANNLPYEDYGLQSEEEISLFLSSADYGITTTPYWLTEKSGAVAAMHCHCLPVICVAREWHSGAELSLKQPANVFLFQKNNFEELMKIKKNVQAQSDLTLITNRLIQLLSESCPN